MSDWWGYEGGGCGPVPPYPYSVPGQGPNLTNIDASLALVTPSDTGISTPLTSAIGGRVQRAGDTMSGRLLLGAGNPVSSLEAVCKQYVDALCAQAALGVAPGAPVTLQSTLAQTITTTAVAQGVANPDAFGIFKPTLYVSGSNDGILNYQVITATLNLSGSLNSVGGVTTSNLNLGSYRGNGAVTGNGVLSEYTTQSSQVNKGPGGLMSIYLAPQNVIFPNDGIFAYGATNVGAQSWAQYMATGLLNNTATNPYEGPTVQFEFDFFASGIDTANSRYLGGQINGSQKYGLGQWTYSTTTAQGAPGNTLQFAANGIPQAGFGQVVSATGIPAGTVVLSANNATGLVTLSAPTTAALAAGAAIVFGGSWPTTFAYGLYFNLGPSVRVGSFMLTNQYACAGVDLRGSFVPQANLLANAAAGATSLHVSDITCFVYANFFGDGAHTYAPPSPTNALRAIVQDANGSRQTVSVIGYAEDGPGLPGGTITLAAPGLATAITDATTSTVTVTPNTAAVWLKDGQYINFDTAANYQIGVDTLNGWLAFNGSCTFNSGLYIPPQGGAGRLYLNKSTATDNYIRYNPFDISTEFVQTANGSDTVLLRLADQGGPTGGWAVFGFGAQMANLPISPTGLPAGSLYRSGAGANAALMIV